MLYGMSSIVGRFLNYLLVPLYTAVIPSATGGYGVVSNVYAYTALILILLTFGMETGFFRFANKSEENPQEVYANSLIFVGGISLLFWVCGLLFLHPVSTFLGYPTHPDYVAMMMTVVALDAVQSIPFAYLRYRQRPLKFALIKLGNIAGNIALNLFFLLACPYLMEHAPHWVDWFYQPEYLVGYIFVSNLIMSVVQMFFFIPELRGFSYRINPRLMKEMLTYSAPIVVLGVAGVLNQTVDKMIYPFLFADRQEGMVQLGIYSAASKVAMIMAMFTQAFRFAYEPFVFGKEKEKDSRSMYANAMKYFYLCSLIAFIVIVAGMDILKYMVASDYWAGLIVVPVVMGAEILKGIYFNLSFWYKLTDRTIWGAWFSVIGCTIIILLNCWLVPQYGFIASAWASVIGYGTITLLSYFVGQRHYVIDYPWRSMAFYTLIGALLYVVLRYLPADWGWGRTIVSLGISCLFIGFIAFREIPTAVLERLFARFGKRN